MKSNQAAGVISGAVSVVPRGWIVLALVLSSWGLVFGAVQLARLIWSLPG